MKRAGANINDDDKRSVLITAIPEEFSQLRTSLQTGVDDTYEKSKLKFRVALPDLQKDRKRGAASETAYACSSSSSSSRSTTSPDHSDDSDDEHVVMYVKPRRGRQRDDK